MKMNVRGSGKDRQVTVTGRREGVIVGPSPREGICGLGWRRRGLGLLLGAEGGECKLLQGPEDAHGEERAGCGSGLGVPAGTDSHPESVSEQAQSQPVLA